MGLGFGGARTDGGPADQPGNILGNDGVQHFCGGRQTQISDLLEKLPADGQAIGDSAAAKGLDFRLLVDPDVPRALQGDPMRLGQVLTNLTNNAVKFTAEGSVTVRVRLANREKDTVRLAFVVEDTGIGIRADDLDSARAAMDAIATGGR